ncbi:MAG TPA: DoxX family membrane protein [Polyangia bacterium]|nr:DoxX family membrane protein [Polyangia bacterium]HVZ86522.1 DoxX family membrane protein [Polyangia bacterium]
MGERIPLGYLVPLRILCGLILVIEGWGKLQHGWLHGTPLLGTLDGWVEAHKTYGFFLPVVQSARAHPKIFGTLVTAGELAVGLAMLLGLLTRLAAFLGALLLFSFAFGGGQGLAPPGNALLMGAIFVVFLFAPPGRVLGLDAALRARFPRWMV